MKSAAVRSTAETADAIQGMSDADWIRLRKVALLYARCRAIEADDLLQEAFRRALAGGRNCPAHVDVVKFLAEAMCSIAHEAKESAGKLPPLVPIANHGGAEAVVDPPDVAPDPEQGAASAQTTATIRAAMLALFDDDETAQVLLEGIMEGMQGEELQELTDLDKTAYESKRKLIRRRIDKKFPQGWTS